MPTNPQPTGIELIAAERQRQVTVEGWTPEHDDEHMASEMARAAACYALPDGYDARYDLWPWDGYWWKPAPCNRIHELAKAGALIAAEIDRLTRLQRKDTPNV